MWIWWPPYCPTSLNNTRPFFENLEHELDYDTDPLTITCISDKLLAEHELINVQPEKKTSREDEKVL